MFKLTVIRSQGQVGNLHSSTSPAYGECITSMSPRYGKYRNAQLDPPSGFEDPAVNMVDPSSYALNENLSEKRLNKGTLSAINGNAVINV
jgi:hypothetical protein